MENLDNAVNDLARLLAGHKVLALTGAGCSTESGIPDYRGPTAPVRRKAPITYQEFVASEAGRRRYWARAVVGWPRIRDARPNAAHTALATMEQRGDLAGLVTQNVDRLHHKAGSLRIVELHGALATVVCLACKARETRTSLHRRLIALNGDVAAPAQALPDGDAAVTQAEVSQFQLVGCLACGGVLKPDVVFFGGNVPRPVHQASNVLMESATALLIVGSSLTVYSGYRFLREAARREMPVGLINLGAVARGQDMVDVHVNASAAQALPRLADAVNT